MKIVQAPDVVLSQQAKPINKIDKSILDLIEEMKKTLVSATDPEGVGLAAPQVGKSLQLFIVKPTPKDDFTIFINPTVTLMQETEKTTPAKKKKEDKRLEGCLSLKDIWGTVKRAPKVAITWQDENGTQNQKVFTGFFATILQHEFDHLQGILFPKRVLEQNGKLYKSHKDEQGEEVFDPIEL
ncbi:MAG TPA: peptide deformylase [Patescibacteria group bacterium]